LSLNRGHFSLGLVVKQLLANLMPSAESFLLLPGGRIRSTGFPKHPASLSGHQPTAEIRLLNQGK
jgi:hypothetical protein